jgi:tRNA A-37 threonylcarbamoyl transferase component Bud32
MATLSTDVGDNVPYEIFFRSVLHRIRQIAAENYKINKISIRLIHTEGSRLSSPIEITGVTKKGKKIHYFGKIIGNSDVFTYRSIQYLKNVYLQLHNKNPIFGVFETPEEMAQGQYQTLKRIYTNGIPTAKPYGCHLVQDSLWLLITEYLDAKPLSSIEKIDSKQINMIFSHLKKMHKKKIYHGDLKPDNIVIGRRIYIIDVGHLSKDVPRGEKQAYDLACIICSFLKYHPADEIIKIAKKYYSLKKLRSVSNYIELVQMRPDIHFNDEMKKKLLYHLSVPSGRFAKK